MILAIRISGLVEIPQRDNETLMRIRLRRKFSATLLKDTEENNKLIQNIRNHIAYGSVSKEDLLVLLEKRAQPIDKKKKIDVKSAVDALMSGKATFESLNIKPFFRLHPPRGGIDSKLHYPKKKGVLGNHGDKIGILLRRML